MCWKLGGDVKRPTPLLRSRAIARGSIRCYNFDAALEQPRFCLHGARSMSDEQRRDPRIATRQHLWCEGQNNAIAAETRDVSRNGMFIVAEDAPEVGSQMKVTLKDEAGEVTLNMEVMWRGAKTEDNKTGVGVKIVGFDKGRDVYERFIGRHLKGSAAGEKTKASLRPSVPIRDSLTPKR
jgi:Tfp pilus assembly protein PilZ